MGTAGLRAHYGWGSPGGGALEVTDAEWTRAFQIMFLSTVRAMRVIADSLPAGGSMALAFQVRSTSRASGQLALTRWNVVSPPWHSSWQESPDLEASG